jgi:Uncharacterised protein conserved in bacteria (DUF2336)
VVAQAESDPELAVETGIRVDLPPALRRQLLRNATEAVRSRLLARAPPHVFEEIRRAIAAVTASVDREMAKIRDFTAATRFVTLLDTNGELNEATLLGFAKERKYEETVAALAVLSQSSVEVKLERERPEMGDQIQVVVTDVTGAVHARFGPASKNYFAAKRLVGKLHQYGSLKEDQVFEFAHSLKFNETAVALSLLCDLPIDVVERALVNNNREMILLLAKALDLSWTTVMSLLFLGAPNYRITAGDLDGMKREFVLLNVDTSKQVLKVYQSRKEAAGALSLRHSPKLQTK